MKVKDIVKKYRLSSNSSVIIQEVNSGDIVELTKTKIRDLEPQYIMNMTVNGFEVIDNVLKIYAE